MESYRKHQFQIDEAADIIQKLYSIALELPEDKFGDAKRKIIVKYDEIERNLIEEFEKAHKANDIARMKDIANSMVHFKGYGQCIDAFIEYSQMVGNFYSLCYVRHVNSSTNIALRKYLECIPRYFVNLILVDYDLKEWHSFVNTNINQNL